MTDGKLKSFSERINRLMDEREAIGADIAQVYAEAKSEGYIPKALRKAIARMRMDPQRRAEEDELLDLYETALGATGRAMRAVEDGATLDEAAAEAGIDRATLARARAVAKRRENATVAEKPGNATADVSRETADAPIDLAVKATAERLFADGNVTVEFHAEPGSLVDRVGATLERIAPGKVQRNVSVAAIDHAAIEADDLAIPDNLRPHLTRAGA